MAIKTLSKAKPGATVQKHKVAPADFEHVLRTYGITATQFTKLKKQVGWKARGTANPHVVHGD